jgi:hypothetical protein
MDIQPKTIVKFFFYLAIFSLIIYIYIVKIPILCFACEEDGTFTRCISGTGKDTTTCEAYKIQQQIYDNVGNAYVKVTNEFGVVTGAFTTAYQEIVKAQQVITDAFAQLDSINIPDIPSINLPNIPNISCSIKLDNLPKMDICKNQLSPSINNAAINPINTTITTLQSKINSVVNTFNDTITPINTSITNLNSSVNDIIKKINDKIGDINGAISTNIPTIKEIDITTINNNAISTVTIPTISTVDLTCNIDLPALIKEKLGSTTLDVCNLLTSQINNNLIPPLNASFKIISDAINIAITNINKNIKDSINIIKNGITTVINMLQAQLDSLNLFGQLTNTVVELLSNIKELNPFAIINTYILPYIQKFFPFATFADTITFLFTMFFIPFVIPLFLIGSSLIDLIPDYNSEEDQQYDDTQEGIPLEQQVQQQVQQQVEEIQEQVIQEQEP